MKKIEILVLVFLFLILLAWAPWMDEKALHDRIFAEHGLTDGSVNKQTGELVCDYDVSWLPFGRYIGSCEAGYYVTFYGSELP
ncbi:MAG: hypothetical protein V1881_02160 [Candidatus Micrarchaeota archaeon]